MKSVMQHQFSNVPSVDIQRSVFDRTHTHKTTFDAGYLVPFYVDEVLPGDTFSVKASIFARLATPIVPLMDNIHLDTHYFFVPLRLLWDKFARWMGEQDEPEQSTDLLAPTITADAEDGGSNPTGFLAGSLEDYFGLPVGVPHLEVSAWWHRAYNLIYNEWYRDQNFAAKVPVNRDLDSELQSDGDYTLLRRMKRHDYFTSCLPWPQKGPGVQLSLGSTADIKGVVPVSTRAANWTYPVDQQPLRMLTTGRANVTGTLASSPTYTPGEIRSTGGTAGTSDLKVFPSNLQISFEDSQSNAYVDLATAVGATINEMREAFQLQRLLERDARGGTRYTELVKSHFGVESPDSRLQRPEFLGGGTYKVQLTPVAQTSETSSTPQATLAAFGTVGGSGGFSKSFTEHGVLLGIVSVRADLTYQRGVHRMFSRRTKYDHYWPALAHLGEQEVLNREIWADGGPNDELVWGYQERFAEYRYYPSKITGLFRSTHPQSLDVWHLSQDFETRPALNKVFLEEDPPIDRIIAVPSEPHFIFDSFIRIRAARPMPVYSVPGLIDHF